MNHLSFEFMERTKSVASSPHKTQSLYRMKSIIVLVWIFAFHFYTSFVFFAGFVAFAGSGLTLLLALSKEKKTISQKWEEIFFLLVAYCFLPFSSTVGVYVLTVCLLLWIMEYLFIYLNGYFIHPVILVLLFLSVCLPGVFESYSKAQIFNFYPSFSGYFFTVFLFLEHQKFFIRIFSQRALVCLLILQLYF